MKRFFATVFTCLLLAQPIQGVGVSDVTQQQIQDDVLEIELIQGFQNPRTLEFEYILRVKSLIETDRVRMDWEVVNGSIAPVSGQTLSDQVTLRKNEEKYIIKKFLPLEPGNEEIRVTGIAFGPSAVYDYYSFTDTEFFINSDLNLNEDSSEYQTSLFTLQTVNALKVILGIGFTVLLVLVIYYRFKIWLDSE